MNIEAQKEAAGFSNDWIVDGIVLSMYSSLLPTNREDGPDAMDLS